MRLKAAPSAAASVFSRVVLPVRRHILDEQMTLGQQGHECEVDGSGGAHYHLGDGLAHLLRQLPRLCRFPACGALLVLLIEHLRCSSMSG